MTHTTTHTPGPWVVNVDGRMIEAQLPNLCNEYEHICDLRGGIKGQINLGNAHLIAAAPAMYEALKALVEYLDTQVQAGKLDDWKHVLVARQALAQAEGR